MYDAGWDNKTMGITQRTDKHRKAQQIVPAWWTLGSYLWHRVVLVQQEAHCFVQPEEKKWM